MEVKTKIRFRSLINRAPKEVFEWHLRDRMVERCIPPTEKVELLYTKGRPNQIGSKVAVRIKFLGLFSFKQVLNYTHVIENESFTRDQVEGVFNEYHYKTMITPQGDHTSEIIDQFEFKLPFPSLLSPLVNQYLKKRIGKFLSYKHQLIDHDIGMMKKYPFQKPYKILISGSHGLIGKNITHFLEFMGHDVYHLNRTHSDKEKEVVWDPESGKCNLFEFEGFDVVIHLAGENIGKGHWTKKKKEKVLKSRSLGTKHLAEVIQKLSNPPTVFISASAVGYYGNCGSELLNEQSPPGKSLFISDVCMQWEKASRELEAKGIRVIRTRFGVVLSGGGGMLKQMLRFFKWGLGGKIGNGHQYMSWVAIDDVVGALYHMMMTPEMKGAVNVVSPHPVPNDIFSKKLSQVLKKWQGPPLPEFAVRALLGQKGEELLLSSTRVDPECLFKSGYTFLYPKLSQALEHVI